MQLGQLSTIHFGHNVTAAVRGDKMLEKQRSDSLLEAASYRLGANESASDNLRPAEFRVTVNASYQVEKANEP